MDQSQKLTNFFLELSLGLLWLLQWCTALSMIALWVWLFQPELDNVPQDIQMCLSGDLKCDLKAIGRHLLPSKVTTPCIFTEAGSYWISTGGTLASAYAKKQSFCLLNAWSTVNIFFREKDPDSCSGHASSSRQEGIIDLLHLCCLYPKLVSPLPTRLPSCKVDFHLGDTIFELIPNSP